MHRRPLAVQFFRAATALAQFLRANYLITLTSGARR